MATTVSERLADGTVEPGAPMSRAPAFRPLAIELRIQFVQRKASFRLAAEFDLAPSSAQPTFSRLVAA